MKKIIIIFLCMVGFTTLNFAQNAPQTKEEVAAQRIKNLNQIVAACKIVALDEKQIGKVKGIIEILYKKQDEINNDESLKTTPDVRKQKLKEANDEKDWKLQNIMGDKWKTYAEARKKLIAEAAAKN